MNLLGSIRRGPPQRTLDCRWNNVISVSRRQVKKMTYSDVQRRDNLDVRLLPRADVFQEKNLFTASCRAIIKALLIAVIQDLQKQVIQRVNKQELGWRNKYNIHLMSGVSQKQIYRECGFLDKLIEYGIIEKRPSQSRWGKQKHQYRLCFSYATLSEDILGLGLQS